MLAAHLVPGYLATDSLFLLESLFFTLAITHWTLNRKLTPHVRTLILIALTGGLILFAVTFLLLLPSLQNMAVSL
jgi:hypothetical protein